MTKGNRVLHRAFGWVGTIVREIDPYDPRVMIVWDRFDGSEVWVDPMDFEVLTPLRLLAECAE